MKKTRHSYSVWELNPDLVQPLTKVLYRHEFYSLLIVVIQTVCQFVG